MHWYIVPIYIHTFPDSHTGVEQRQHVPGMGSPVVRAPLAAGVVHAHNPKADPAQALLGLPEAMAPLPVGWTACTLDEALAHFLTVVGRSALPAEVF